MGTKSYRDWSPKQSFLLPPSPLEWLPEGHLAYFILDLLEELDLSAIEGRIQGKDARGTSPYSPAMMVGLFLYAYCVGVYSSRKIARAISEDVAFRVLAGGNQPHFTTISDFRKTFLAELEGLFVQVLKLCRQAGLVKLGQVAIDGTKVQANASKHKAMSYDHMQKLEERLEAEVKELLERASQVDQEEDQRWGEGQREEDLPEELRRRHERLERLRKAKAELEAAARRSRAAELHDQAQSSRQRSAGAETSCRRKLNQTLAKKQEKQAEELEAVNEELEDEPTCPPLSTSKGLHTHRVPTRPDGVPKPKAQRNFTDPDSRIMESGGSILQGYNCQAAVDGAHQVIVAHGVTNQCPDNANLAPMLEQAKANCGGAPVHCTADTGYWEPRVAEQAEALGSQALVATERRRHWDADDTVTEGKPPPDATAQEKMRWKMRTAEGREIYARRKCIVEPVFGQIKEARGFRRFFLRGLSAVDREWGFLCTAHNLLKLFRHAPAVAGA